MSISDLKNGISDLRNIVERMDYHIGGTAADRVKIKQCADTPLQDTCKRLGISLQIGESEYTLTYGAVHAQGRTREGALLNFLSALLGKK